MPAKDQISPFPPIFCYLSKPNSCKKRGFFDYPGRSDLYLPQVIRLELPLLRSGSLSCSSELLVTCRSAAWSLQELQSVLQFHELITISLEIQKLFLLPRFCLSGLCLPSSGVPWQGCWTDGPSQPKACCDSKFGQ